MVSTSGPEMGGVEPEFSYSYAMEGLHCMMWTMPTFQETAMTVLFPERRGHLKRRACRVSERVCKVLVTPQGVMEKSVAWGNEEPQVRQASGSLPPFALSLGYKSRRRPLYFHSIGNPADTVRRDFH